MHRAAGPTVARSSTQTPESGPPGPSGPADTGAPGVVGISVTGRGAGQKFFGRPSLRRAMMFFWISEEPPPMVSITVYR